MSFTDKKYHADIVIIGGGISGLVTTLELLDTGKRILLIERDNQEKLGGLARDAAGEIMIVDTPVQRRLGIKDSPELAFSDWKRYASFGKNSYLQEEWARKYTEYSCRYIYEWLENINIRFQPFLKWSERGMIDTGNRYPRTHLAWGTGAEIVKSVIDRIGLHPNRDRLEFKFRHRVNRFLKTGGKITGCSGIVESTHSPFEVGADAIVIASGGICGGDLSSLTSHYDQGRYGDLPSSLLNGGHRFADGIIHDAVEKEGGFTKNLEKNLISPSGVHYPDSFRSDHGFCINPAKSALWVNAEGRRIGRPPLMGGTDTKFLKDSILKEPGQFSWQIMNFNIAAREISAGSAMFLDSVKRARKISWLKELFFGKKSMIKRLTEECDDFVHGDTVEELVCRMNMLEPEFKVDKDTLKNELQEYDEMMKASGSYLSDDQLFRIASFRKYIYDRYTISNFKSILDPSERPLIAVRMRPITVASLGGVVTDLASRVMTSSGKAFENLYAVGEAAGFGGGGIHGERSLGGTFIGASLLTAQAAASSIKERIL